MADWRAEYKKQGWDNGHAGGMIYTPDGVYANGSDATVKLLAREDGDFVVVTLHILGVKVAEKRSAIEDPMRAAQLMGQALGVVEKAAGECRGACVPVVTRKREFGAKELEALRDRIEGADKKDVFVVAGNSRSYPVDLLAREVDRQTLADAQARADAETRAESARLKAKPGRKCNDCGYTIDDCECGGLRPQTSYG